MKYVAEITDLMSAYSGKRFHVKHLVNYVEPRACSRRRSSVRVSVHRALNALEEMGVVESTRRSIENGKSAEYWWVANYSAE